MNRRRQRLEPGESVIFSVVETRPILTTLILVLLKIGRVGRARNGWDVRCLGLLAHKLTPISLLEEWVASDVTALVLEAAQTSGGVGHQYLRDEIFRVL